MIIMIDRDHDQAAQAACSDHIFNGNISLSLFPVWLTDKGLARAS